MNRLALIIFPFLLAACSTGVGQDSATTPAAIPEETPESAPALITATPSPTPPAARPLQPKITYNGVKIQGKFIAITFDDGPHKTFTPQLLDILARKNIKATFFVVGQNVEAYPAIAARIVRDGHEIANHSWSHPSFTKLSKEGVRSQLDRTAKAIKQSTGVTPTVMRPPYGAFTPSMVSWIYQDFGYKNILWTVDPLDWKKPGTTVLAQRIVSGTRPGSIILVHDIHQSSVLAMPSVIDQLLAQGYQFVTVSQLIAMENVESAQPVSMVNSQTPESCPHP